MLLFLAHRDNVYWYQMNDLDLCLKVVQGHVNHCVTFAIDKEALPQFGFGTKYTTATSLPQLSQKQLGKIQKNKKQNCRLDSRS